ncbi:MAG: hypothetical protein IJX39_07710 [Clostridia bacterium]|nr:hypothetical protein [Clostridia bacterium]
MKKKWFAWLAMLLSLCLLFSSCSAGGAFEPALFQVARASFSSFFNKATNLLSGNRPLFLDDACRFSLVTDGTCAEQVDATVNAILAKTGVDLKSSTDDSNPKFRIGLDLTDSITNADYYIGFSGEDLIVTAKNEPMLRQALLYFEATFINGSRANLGDGYFYIPEDLACFGEKNDLIDEEGSPLYTIIYPENADKTSSAAIGSLRASIMAASGVNLTLQSDFFTPDNVEESREILVGLTNREESAAAATGLDHASYRIEISGNKVVIVAANGYMLQKAVDRFTELFIPPRSADGSGEENRLALPISFSLFYTESVLLLAKDRYTPYTLIYASDIDTNGINRIDQFVSTFNRITGAHLTAASDAQVSAQAATGKEILIGKTNRSPDITSDTDWSIAVSGERIQVSAGSTTALRYALNALLQQIYEYGMKQNAVAESNGHPMAIDLPLVFFPTDIALQGNVPTTTPR